MIEKRCAIHLENTLDASAIDVLKPKSGIKKAEKPRAKSTPAAEDDLSL